MKITGKAEGHISGCVPLSGQTDSASPKSLDPHYASVSNTRTNNSSTSTENNTNLSAAKNFISRKLLPLELNKLKAVLHKKNDVQALASTLSALEITIEQNPQASLSIENDPLLNFQKTSSLESAFNNHQPLLLRTLSSNDDQEVKFRSIRFGHSGKTPVKRETDTLNNVISGRNTVIVPATLISKNVKSNTISQLAGTRPKWAGLPSVISYPLSSSDVEVQKLHDRPGFGDIHSFASSQGFTKRFTTFASTLSHSEQLKLLKEETEGLIKEDKFRRNDTFVGSLNDLQNELIARQQKTPHISLRHNEYCARLELWDAKAIELGEHKDVAIATMIEFNLEMRALHRHLETDGEGIHSEQITSHVARQLSLPSPSNPMLLDKKAVAQATNAYPSAKKEQALTDILQRLKEGVTLCTYEQTESGSKIRSLALEDFESHDIVAGIKLFLSSRLHTDRDDIDSANRHENGLK